VAVLYTTTDGIQLARLDDSGWHTVSLGISGTKPVAELDHAGRLHIAYEQDYQVFYTTLDLQTSALEPPQLAAHYPAGNPSMVLIDDEPLLAYQGEGIVSLHDNLHVYDKLRSSGGTSIAWCRLTSRGWEHAELIRSSEISLKRDPRQESGGVKRQPPIFHNRLEEVRLPQLALDADGVAWLFYSNVTRRHTYYARWLGDRFGDRTVARGPYYSLAPFMFVEKRPRALPAGEETDHRLGWVSSAMGRLVFHHLQLPRYDNRVARRVVFLDMLEVAAATGVSSHLGKLQRHPQNPLAGPGITGPTSDGSIMFCKVFPRADGFEMIYRPYYFNQPGRDRSVVVGPYTRMLSADGLRWQDDADAGRPYDGPGITADYPDPADGPTGMATIDGEPVTFRPFYIEDTQETDPGMRFKGLVYRWSGFDRTSAVVTSPDARVWRLHNELPEVIRGEDEWLLIDADEADPRYRFKLYIKYIGMAGRTVMLYTSPDFLHWEPSYDLLDPDEPGQLPAVNPFPVGHVVIDPDAAEQPFEEEVHATRAWRENGLVMLHYDAFMLGANQHVNKALAVSRDGFHFSRVKGGEPNLARGAAGAWDSGRIRTLPPIRRDGQLWIYFVAGPPQLGSVTESFMYPLGSGVYDAMFGLRHERPRHDLRLFRLGLATIREDGWSFLRGDLAAQQRSMRTTAVALHRDGGRRLFINATLASASGLAVSVHVAPNGTGGTSTAIDGFAAGDCQIDGTDGTWLPVTWQGHDIGELAPQPVVLQFWFADPHSRLYSFGFSSSSGGSNGEAQAKQQAVPRA
jgi:hypothetical protein